MPTEGWKQLVAGWPWFDGQGRYPIPAYSEFMPPPRLGRRAYGGTDPVLFAEDDRWGWHVTEYEEALQLQPGLERLAKQIVGALVHLGSGGSAHGISHGKLENNPYWPDDLAKHAGKLAHERYVVLMPLALSRTQDDKGRVRWTLFGGSEQGPARAFWQSFFTAPKQEIPQDKALGILRRLLASAHHVALDRFTDLHEAGFRILPLEADRSSSSGWQEGPLPRWVAPYLWTKGQAAHSAKYLLTFRPFKRLPADLQHAYLAGDLHLLPFPGSLVFWGTQPYRQLEKDMPFAQQVPLLHLVPRHEAWFDIRVPQSGWLHEPKAGQPGPDGHGPVRNTFKRTHRWEHMLRHQDPLSVADGEDRLAHVLFSTLPQDVCLYGKPMARNAQVWDNQYRLLLDGPAASSDAIESTIRAIEEGGMFGYRFQYPAMRVGRHEVYWHRPLVAFLSQQTGEPALLPDAPTGYLTAYQAGAKAVAGPIELWPRILEREQYLAAVHLFEGSHHLHPYATTINIRKLLEARQLLSHLGAPGLPAPFARRLLSASRHETLHTWLDSLVHHAKDPPRARRLADELRGGLTDMQFIGSGAKRGLPRALTYHRTARRAWEVEYWTTIAHLAEGKYLTKNNADCVRDPVTQSQLHHHHRDLDHLGDYLLEYYAKVVKAARMTGRALVGEMPFRWQTDFNYFWSGGWLNNHAGQAEERNIMVVIPGRNRRRAVVMGDHYDTAYMEDHFATQPDGKGPRLAAAGADDNHSATVALMLGAPVFLELSRRGKLACDIWLIHLTGEEFPADCLGARHLTQKLVEGTLQMRLAGGGTRDLSRTRVQGVYVLDMVAHNNDHERDIFQIAPGAGAESMWLAYQAHVANEIWNASAPAWNRRSSRRGCGRGERSTRGSDVPKIALHPQLDGEVRPPFDPRSTLYNTDGQIFSDAGVPVVLFMENYDINRQGYHDAHDTMENIDLDYGAALAAIAIESVARAATEKAEW
jgi:hypothetical protein